MPQVPGMQWGKKARWTAGAVGTLWVLIGFGVLASEPLGVGQEAKSFSLETLNGREVRLADFVGRQPVLLAFISISCFECEETAPVLRRAIDRYQEGGRLQVLFIAIANKKGARWIERSGKYDARAPILVEKTSKDILETADGYGVEATPTLILIGRDGRIAWRHLGRVSFDALDAEIGKVL